MKNIIYNVVGTTHLFQGKIKELFEDLMQNQHYTEEEGKRIVDDFFYTINQNIESTKTELQLKVDNFVKENNLEKFINWKQDFEQFMKDWKATSLLPTKIKHYK